MSDSPKKVIEKNSHGEYVFTPYGEFLSYYHAHVQIFNQLIERKKLTKNESDSLSQSIKSFMVTNVKKTDHFFENINNFAGILGISQANLQSYLNENFLGILNKVQEKLKGQEIEKQASSSGVGNKSYNSILEELNDIFGEKLLKNIKFIREEGRIVLVDLTTGNLIEPKSSTTGEEPASQQVSKKTEPELIHRGPEKSILKEIIELFGGELKGQTLEVQNPNNFISTAEMQPASRAEKKPEKEELGIIEDLQFEDDSIQQEPQSQMEGNENQTMDLDFLLSQVPEKPKDPVDDFMFKEYSAIMKAIQSYQSAKDMEGYSRWMSSCSELEKCFISIRNYLAKEQKGEAVNWENIFRTISQKTDLTEDSLRNLKGRIEIFRQTKSVQDGCIQEFKNLPPQVLGIAKSAWPHIANSFELMPDIENVESSIQNILSRIRNENERKPISNILVSAITKLRQVLEG